MTKPQMTLPNGDVLYEGDYAVTREGDTVGPICFNYNGRLAGWGSSKAIVYTDTGMCKSSLKPCDADLVAKWTDQDNTPVLWRDMTPQQKGALLLAHHEGEVIQLRHHLGDWLDRDKPDWSDNCAYRIKPSKPEPKVETVVLMVHDNGVSLPFVDSFMTNPTCKITYTRKGGKPDCDSVKMEEL